MGTAEPPSDLSAFSLEFERGGPMTTESDAKSLTRRAICPAGLRVPRDPGELTWSASVAAVPRALAPRLSLADGDCLLLRRFLMDDGLDLAD